MYVDISATVVRIERPGRVFRAGCRVLCDDMTINKRIAVLLVIDSAKFSPSLLVGVRSGENPRHSTDTYNNHVCSTAYW